MLFLDRLSSLKWSVNLFLAPLEHTYPASSLQLNQLVSCQGFGISLLQWCRTR